MAKIFQITKRVKDPATGKMVEKMDPKTGKSMMYARWRVRICDWQGRRRNVTLSKNKAEAQKQADLLETQALEMKKGLRPTPPPESKAKRRPFLDIRRSTLPGETPREAVKAGLGRLRTRATGDRCCCGGRKR